MIEDIRWIVRWKEDNRTQGRYTLQEKEKVLQIKKDGEWHDVKIVYQNAILAEECEE